MSYFPDLFNFVLVVPLFKSSNPLLPNNYRPISLLSVFNTILEFLNTRVSKTFKPLQYNQHVHNIF